MSNPMTDAFSKSCLYNFFVVVFFPKMLNWSKILNCNIGRSQVAPGLVPINFENKSSESALSVYPVAIANCKEKR